MTKKYTFNQFSLRQELIDALEKKNFQNPTPVQVQVLKEKNIMDEDIVVQAKTGSGKTLAFGLPLLNTLDSVPKQPIFLVLSPTRELAIQTAHELKWLGDEMGIKVATLVGGMDIAHQRRELLSGPVFVVGTPGRVLDHIRRRNYFTENIKTIVLDEGDHMLDLGFREELETILESHSHVDRIWMFSATIPSEMRKLCRRYLSNPRWISLDQDITGHEDIKHGVFLVPSQYRLKSLVNVLLWEEPEKALIFCPTRQQTIECTAFLTQSGFAANALHGEMTQRERNASLNAFRSGVITYLVATDVAARGLDIDKVSHVIQLGFPGDLNNYIHRSGRTGRAGNTGLSLSLLTHREASQFRHIFSKSSLQVEWKSLPDKEDIFMKSQQKIEQELIDTNWTAEDHFQKWAQNLLAKRNPVGLLSKLLQWNNINANKGYDLKAFLELEEPKNRERQPGRFRDGNPHQRKNKKHSFAFANTIRLSTGTNTGWEVGRLLGTLCRILEIDRQEIGNIRLRKNHALVEVSPMAFRRFQEKKPKFIEARLVDHSSQVKNASRSGGYVSSN